MTQVDKEHYAFGSYTDIDRWSSYYFQLEQILSLRPQSVLEVGVGERVVKDYLERKGIKHQAVDSATDLRPDIVGDVRKLPCQDDSFEVVCAYEVLEHLSFADFDTALSELARVSKKHVLLSLPHFGPPLQLHVKVPFLPKLRLSIKIPYHKKHTWNGQHYWEIGKKEYSPSRIRRHIEKFFVIEREFIPFESQYHHFFTLRKKNV